MSFPPAEYLPYLQYAAPPLVGAFIGYLTNKIAIRMLFRPLRAWHLFGCRIPMTPGVIPSRRQQLARNMGEVVGDHLLTSEEIGKALQEEKFQQHLLNVIAERIGNILHRDLPPLPEMVPEGYRMYSDLGLATLKQQLKLYVNDFIHSPDFAKKMEGAIDDRVAHLLKRRCGDILDDSRRGEIYGFLHEVIARMLTSQTMAEWLNDYVRRQVTEILKQQKSLKQILPASLLDFLEDSIRRQTPTLLARLAAILKEPEVRDSIVRGACAGVEKFILSLGPMAPMVQNFISMELVDQKIREYLEEKEEAISSWLSSEKLQRKVGIILAERFVYFISTPVAAMVDGKETGRVDEFCHTISTQVALALRDSEIAEAIAQMIRENAETHLEGGEIAIGRALAGILGDEGLDTFRSWIKKEAVSLLRSPETAKTLDGMIDGMVDGLMVRRIGKLSRLLPAGVRREIYVSIQQLTSNMLAQEVPGLVESLDIKTIVAEKLNSLDLLRLEQLLLSIMEEQFKYINLFGALLGFMIGCLNLIVLGMR